MDKVTDAVIKEWIEEYQQKHVDAIKDGNEYGADRSLSRVVFLKMLYSAIEDRS